MGSLDSGRRPAVDHRVGFRAMCAPMIPWVLIDTAKVPGGGELRLKRRGGEFSIMLGANELMNSRLSGSEEALASLSCRKIRDRASPQILIGGLGMGFTLRAALAELNDDAGVTVAELVPAVAAWARGPMAEIFGGSLDDPRVTLFEGNVGGLIRSAKARYDAILLDVDNGPEGLTSSSNDALYDLAGLQAAWRALRPGGVLAVWSQGPDEHFTRRLRKAGFAVETVKVRANKGRSGARHIVWIAEKGESKE
jgi:spermidine synthase